MAQKDLERNVEYIVGLVKERPGYYDNVALINSAFEITESKEDFSIPKDLAWEAILEARKRELIFIGNPPKKEPGKTCGSISRTDRRYYATTDNSKSQ